MANVMSASTDRFGMTSSPRRYERHRSATKLQSQTDPIIKCVELDYLSELQEFLAKNSERYTQNLLDEALHRAAELGKAESCELLLKAGSDINSLESEMNYEKRFDNSRCVFSSEQAQQDTWLKNHSSFCGTALHLAVENERVATVQILLQNGACINMTDRNGLTPLMLACMRRGNKEIVRLLTSEKDCNIEAKEKQSGRTALHFAADNGDTDAVKILLESGAKADSYDNKRSTPLILCCARPTYENPRWPPKETLECVQTLFDHGAFVNIFNDEDQSALELAVSSRLLETVEFLLQKSALLQPQTLRIACLEMRDPEMINILLKEGNSFQDEFLCAILLVVICTVTSKWSLNARKQEENTHEIARILIKNISGPDSYLTVSSMDSSDMAREFGEDFLEVFPKSDQLELQTYGFLGFALLKGKYSIAQMLYVVGCRDKLARMSGNTKVVQLANSHPFLKQWLALALTRAATLEAMAMAQYFYDASALDAIEAYDECIHDSAHGMIDKTYSRREDAKASSARSILLYN